MKKLLAAAVILAFFLIVCVCTPAFATDREPGVYLAQQSEEKAAEADEDIDEDDEYDDVVVQINDPLYRLNHEFFLCNDAMYVCFIRPAARGYNTVMPEAIRIAVKNFFYNLRFPIRCVNCLLQAKGSKAMDEFATFLDPISWLDLDWKTKYGILAYDEFNQISFKIDDIDAMKEAVLDPYVAIRDAYVEHRNKLIAE